MPEKKRILIVDDEDNDCNALSSMLNHLGFENVVIVKTGEETLNILKDGSFDLIVADLMMPGISGIKLLKRIRNSTPNLPY